MEMNLVRQITEEIRVYIEQCKLKIYENYSKIPPLIDISRLSSNVIYASKGGAITVMPSQTYTNDPIYLKQPI